MSNHSKNAKTIAVAFLSLAFIAFWVAQKYFGSVFANQDSATTLFTNTYGIVALIGGLFALYISKYWGGLKSLIGRAIFVFGLGLLAQEFGQLMYAFYIYVQKIEVPYPSLGDIGYFGSVILYIYGASLLLRATGAKFSLKSMGNKLLALILPFALLAVSYLIFLRGYEFDWSSPVTVLLDFGYPLLQATYLAIALLTFMLSRKYLGGIMRLVILFVLISLTFQYIADFTFLYQVKNETWAPGGINDLIYLISYALMSLSLLKFESVVKKLDKKEE